MASENDKLDVFISYSTKNKNVADAVVANFEHNGIKCWYAPRDIMPGKEWVSAIKEGLHDAKVFVLIFTAEYVFGAGSSKSRTRRRTGTSWRSAPPFLAVTAIVPS